MKKMTALLLAALMVLSMAACASKPAETAESDLAYIQDKGTLVVGITDFAPMDYQNESGEWVGFDADGAVSRQSADDAEARWKAAAANLENAKAALSLANKGPRSEDIAAAEAQLSALKAGLENDLYNLSQATLVAPQDGVIRSRLMETGDMASAARPVYLIGLSDPKWIRAYVPESRLGELREGMEADVYVDSFPNEAIKGKVGYISDTAEFTPKSVQTEELRTSLLYEVRIFVDDEENRLRMGMPATVKF